MVTTNENALKKSKEKHNGLIWIVTLEDTYPSSILGVYPSYDAAYESVSEIQHMEYLIRGWDIVSNMEVDDTDNDEETT